MAKEPKDGMPLDPLDFEDTNVLVRVFPEASDVSRLICSHLQAIESPKHRKAVGNNLRVLIKKLTLHRQLPNEKWILDRTENCVEVPSSSNDCEILRNTVGRDTFDELVGGRILYKTVLDGANGQYGVCVEPESIAHFVKNSDLQQVQGGRLDSEEKLFFKGLQCEIFEVFDDETKLSVVFVWFPGSVPSENVCLFFKVDNGCLLKDKHLNLIPPAKDDFVAGESLYIPVPAYLWLIELIALDSSSPPAQLQRSMLMQKEAKFRKIFHNDGAQNEIWGYFVSMTLSPADPRSRKCRGGFLYGLPGTGKSTILAFFASELGMRVLFFGNMSKLLSCFIGQSQKSMRLLFSIADTFQIVPLFPDF